MRCTLLHTIDCKSTFRQCLSIPLSKAHRVDLMDESFWYSSFIPSFYHPQLIERWAPLFKNYVKKAQDHLDCLSAFEEHFLEQEKHWPAMIKVRTHVISLCLSVFLSFSFSLPFSFSLFLFCSQRPRNAMKPT